MQRIAWLLLICASSFLPGTSFAADGEPVDFTDAVVTQFAERSAGTLHGTTSSAFTSATDEACGIAPDMRGDTRTAAPIIAALGGIVIDWLFSRAMSGIGKRLKKNIEEHSVSYSNEPVFQNMFGPEWNKNESCVVMQRIECKVDPASVKAGTASCAGSGTVGFSVGIKLRNEGQYIRALPYAMHLQNLKPKHHKGKATAAATVRIEAVGMNADDAAGYLWKSQDIALAALACDVSKDKVSGPACAQSYGLKPNHWKRSQIIPMPPRTVQAIVFTVGELGGPPRAKKGLAEFLDATEGSISAALSEAFQKKIDLKE